MCLLVKTMVCLISPALQPSEPLTPVRGSHPPPFFLWKHLHPWHPNSPHAKCSPVYKEPLQRASSCPDGRMAPPFNKALHCVQYLCFGKLYPCVVVGWPPGGTVAGRPGTGIFPWWYEIWIYHLPLTYMRPPPPISPW